MHFYSFQEMSRRSYTARIRADADTISVSIPENITADVSGNGNTASNTLQVRHCTDSQLSLYSKTNNTRKLIRSNETTNTI